MNNIVYFKKLEYLSDCIRRHNKWSEVYNVPTQKHFIAHLETIIRRTYNEITVLAKT